MLEIRQGIGQLEGKDAAFARIPEYWLENRVKPAFEGRVLTVTAAKRRPMIAATI